MIRLVRGVRAYMEALFTRHLCTQSGSHTESDRVARADQTPEALHRELDRLEERLATRVVDAEAFFLKRPPGRDPRG